VAKEISHECMTKVKDLMGEALRYKLIFHVCRLAFFSAPVLPSRVEPAINSSPTFAQVDPPGREGVAEAGTLEVGGQPHYTCRRVPWMQSELHLRPAAH